MSEYRGRASRIAMYKSKEIFPLFFDIFLHVLIKASFTEYRNNRSKPIYFRRNVPTRDGQKIKIKVSSAPAGSSKNRPRPECCQGKFR